MATQGYRLLDFVVGIHDPRVVGRTDQDLVDILVVSLRAVMAGVEGWDDIEDWGSENEAMLRRYLKLRNGVPGHDTIHRVFELLDPREVQKRFADWVGHVCVALERPVIAIDGKSLRGSGSVKRGVKALQWVSAYATEVGVVLAQQRCAEKSNESTAIEQLLPSLALKGAIVTIDAMGCQTEIAQTIVARGGDYLLSVKDNQPKLHEAIQEYFAIAEAEGFRHLQPEVSETLNKGHGRLETRRCTVLAAPAYLEELALEGRACPGEDGSATRDRRQGGNRDSLCHHLVGPERTGDPAGGAAALGYPKRAVSLPGCGLPGDASAIWLRNAAANFRLLRRFALNLFRLDKASKKSLPKKRKAAAWNSACVVELLNLQPPQET